MGRGERIARGQFVEQALGWSGLKVNNLIEFFFGHGVFSVGVVGELELTDWLVSGFSLFVNFHPNGSDLINVDVKGI